MSDNQTINLNHREVMFTPGETLLDVARRENEMIPTLCHDSRLEPMGSCRTCLVEVNSGGRPLPACATPAQKGMEVITESDALGHYRRDLLALYLADHPQDRDAAEQRGPNQLWKMADCYDVSESWPSMDCSRESRPHDENPYIDFSAEACILCARCVRYCAEVEGVSSITLAGRGSETTIYTADGLGLLDTTCEMCGGCIDVCPTGAMAEKIPLVRGDRPEETLQKVRTTCNYCGVGCQMDLNVDPQGEEGRGRVVKVTSPEPGTTTNDGNLCVKGRFAYHFIHHPDRITVPWVRREDGQLHESTWSEALEVAAQGLAGVRERHGSDSLGFVSSSRCTVEENYLMQKFSRAVFSTNNIHQCAAT